MKPDRPMRLPKAAALLALLAALGGCVAVPYTPAPYYSGYGYYGGGNYSGYYSSPYYYSPYYYSPYYYQPYAYPVFPSVSIWGGWGGGHHWH